MKCGRDDSLLTAERLTFSTSSQDQRLISSSVLPGAAVTVIVNLPPISCVGLRDRDALRQFRRKRVACKAARFCPSHNTGEQVQVGLARREARGRVPGDVKTRQRRLVVHVQTDFALQFRNPLLHPPHGRPRRNRTEILDHRLRLGDVDVARDDQRAVVRRVKALKKFSTSGFDAEVRSSMCTR